MQKIELKAVKRDIFGKKESKKIRKEEMVPCVINGGGEPAHFSVDVKELKPLIYTPNCYLLEFDIEGTKETAVLKEVQFHPVKEEVLHVDFTRVIPGKPVTVELPVTVFGNSEGVRQGGKLAINKRKLTVSGFIENLPDELKIDISELQLGKSIFVGDLSFENIAILTPASTAVCAVKMTRAARGAAAAEANS